MGLLLLVISTATPTVVEDRFSESANELEREKPTERSPWIWQFATSFVKPVQRAHAENRSKRTPTT